jgi:hypothetical protein
MGGCARLFPWAAGWKDSVLLNDKETVDVLVSEVIGPQPQFAPKKLWRLGLWQGGKRRRGRPM